MAFGLAIHRFGVAKGQVSRNVDGANRVLRGCKRVQERRDQRFAWQLEGWNFNRREGGGRSTHRPQRPLLTHPHKFLLRQMKCIEEAWKSEAGLRCPHLCFASVPTARQPGAYALADSGTALQQTSG